jgi:hypothetical protein
MNSACREEFGEDKSDGLKTSDEAVARFQGREQRLRLGQVS